MKGIPTLVALESYSALGAALEEALSKYQSVSDFPWSNYLMLERDIFDNGFIGLESLSSHVSEIVLLIIICTITNFAHINLQYSISDGCGYY